jgi:hypothetical protein
MTALAWSFTIKVDGRHTCAVLKADGDRCNFVYNSKSTTTSHVKQHLYNKHDIEDINSAAGSAILKAIADKKLTQLQLEVPKTVIVIDGECTLVKAFNYFAACSVPFSHVDMPEFRELISLPYGVTCRQTFTKAFIKAGFDIRDTAVKALRDAKKPVTVAIDSGTVWRRYMVIVLASPDIPAVVCDIAHDAAYGGRFTAVNIVRHIGGLLATTLKDLRIVAFVGDNAANIQRAFANMAPGAVDVETEAAAEARMTAMVELEPGEQVVEEEVADTIRGFKSVGGYWKIRCKAHTTQLIVRAFIKSEFPTLEKKVYDATIAHKTSATICETRWNTVYLALKEVSPLITDTDDKSLFRDAQEALLPFYLATEELQKMGATTWNALRALTFLHNYVTTSGSRNRAAATIIAERAGWLLSPAVVLVAYLSPAMQPLNVVADRQALRDLHFLACQNSAEANTYAAEVQARTILDEPESVTAETLFEWYGARLAQWPKTEAALHSLVAIAPTEADCERAFSKLKAAVSANRSHTRPEASTAHLMYSSGREYVEEVSKLRLKSMKPPAEIPAAVMNWICSLAAASMREVQAPRVAPRRAREDAADAAQAAPAAHAAAAAAAGAAPPAPALFCCICRVDHSRRRKEEAAVGYNCERCKQWVGVACLKPLLNWQVMVEAGLCPTDFRRK